MSPEIIWLPQLVVEYVVLAFRGQGWCKNMLARTWVLDREGMQL